MTETILRPPGEAKLEAQELSVLYGEKRALQPVSLMIPDRKVSSACGVVG